MLFTIGVLLYLLLGFIGAAYIVRSGMLYHKETTIDSGSISL